MMEKQASLLGLRSGDSILDLGSGNGAFEKQLQRWSGSPSSLSVVSIDLVGEALRRARSGLARTQRSACEISASFINANLNLGNYQQGIPLKSKCFSGAVASFLLGYLDNPELVLQEIRRLLRPGGRLVESTLCCDADISLLYAESVAEFRLGVAGSELPGIEDAELNVVAQNFLNDAAKILQLEEAGVFQFWETAGLRTLVSDAGFSDVTITTSLGRPPQALIVSATRS
jgi:ubiquinone/menaquinone biosynthesis C-methylase UbiE